jgi:hypothetical protein
MKQKITIAIDRHLLNREQSFAAERGASISAMLASELK